MEYIGIDKEKLEEWYALWHERQRAPHIETVRENIIKRVRAINGNQEIEEQKWEIIHKGTYEECSEVLKKKWKQYYE